MNIYIKYVTYKANVLKRQADNFYEEAKVKPLDALLKIIITSGVTMGILWVVTVFTLIIWPIHTPAMYKDDFLYPLSQNAPMALMMFFMVICLTSVAILAAIHLRRLAIRIFSHIQDEIEELDETGHIKGYKNKIELDDEDKTDDSGNDDNDEKSNIDLLYDATKFRER